MKIKIFGVEIDNYPCDEVVNIIIRHALYNRTPEYVVTPNAHYLVKFQKDTQVREIYHNAFLSVPDGFPLSWVAKLQNTPLKDCINGTDLLQKLCAVAAKKNLSVFLLGGCPGTAKQAAKILQQRNPNLIVVGTYCPPDGFEQNKAELVKIKQMVEAAAPDLLFVGLDTPKQEKWIAANYQKISVPVSIGIGASFELVGGVVPQAPIWMQQVGLEWFYRLIVESRGSFLSTVVINTTFIWLLIKQQLNLSKLNIKPN